MQKPFDINSLTKLWKTLSSSQILEQKINEYIRFVGLGIMQVINWVKDEWWFFIFTFM